LVVIGILGIVVGSSMLFLTNILKGSNQAQVVGEIKQNGQTVLDVIDRQIRNAENVEDFTPLFISPPDDAIKLNITNSASSIYIACFNRDITTSPKKNGWIGILNSTSAPSSVSEFLKLTNTSEVSGIDLECDTSTFSISGLISDSYPQVVQVRFKVYQGVEAPNRLDFNASSEFKTTISLRKYTF
jgi:type II secretory pathway pseudopilin PulG